MYIELIGNSGVTGIDTILCIYNLPEASGVTGGIIYLFETQDQIKKKFKQRFTLMQVLTGIMSNYYFQRVKEVYKIKLSIKKGKENTEMKRAMKYTIIKQLNSLLGKMENLCQSSLLILKINTS